MILARDRAAPLRFLIGLLLAWVVVRGAIVAGWRPDEDAGGHWGPSPGWLMARMPIAATLPAAIAHGIAGVVRDEAARIVRPPAPAAEPAPDSPMRVEAPLSGEVMRLLAVASYAPTTAPYFPRGELGTQAMAAFATPPLPETRSPLSGSAWAFVRGGGHATPLSPDGQIGGGQAGIRVLYRLGGGLSAAARLSRAIGGPGQSEAAIGLDWQPVATLPAHLMLDRRIALDSGGRSAWALGVAAGVYAQPVTEAIRLDGYAQAGMVGARRRDLYADGAARMGHEVDLGDGRSLTLGGGAWAAAQPGAARLDAGPSAVLRVPVEKAVLAAALDWRERVTGDARPHSGVALTMGVDF